MTEITLQKVCFVAFLLMLFFGLLLFRRREQSITGMCHADYIKLCQRIIHCPTTTELYSMEEDVDLFFDRYFRLVEPETLNRRLSDLYAKMANRRTALYC
jgi:hypothetical protein